MGGRPLRDVFEAVDHGKAYDYMFSLTQGRRIDEPAVLRMHELFYQNIDPGYAGRYRDRRVIITGSRYPTTAPEKLEDEMEGLFQWVEKERETLHPVEFAAQLHKRFVFIHPFLDGNGRIARLLMNMALIQDCYLPAVIPPILRADYISLLEQLIRRIRILWNLSRNGSWNPKRKFCGCLKSPFQTFRKIPRRSREEGDERKHHPNLIFAFSVGPTKRHSQNWLCRLL